MPDLTKYEQLAQQYGPPNCWTGTSGKLAAAIQELIQIVLVLTSITERTDRSFVLERWPLA